MALGVVVVVAACGFQHGGAPNGHGDGGTSSDGGGGSDARADAPLDAPLGTWGPPSLLFGGMGDDDPTLTGDMLELYFNRAADIYKATRSATDQPWGLPSLVVELSSAFNETTPEISYDGLTMFLASDRPGTMGFDDVWMSTRPDRSTAWTTPVEVAELSSNAEDGASAPSSDLLSIVLFSSPSGNADVYRSKRGSTSAKWGKPAALLAVNTPSDDFSPMQSADGLAIYFDSTRSGTSDDLYVVTRPNTSSNYGAALPILELDTAGAESDPWISPDGRHLFFTRDGQLYESVR
jgi:hypothetical protein